MPEEVALHLAPALSSIDETLWDGLANPAASTKNPFLRWAFLQALEETGCVGADTGWQGLHLIAQNQAGKMVGAVPLYLKTHSQGEYVFDHGWAQAYEQAGGQYYPKLQSAIPFTPVTGARLLSPDPQVRTMLANGMQAAAREITASSVHVTFASDRDADTLESAGFCRRMDVQYHFHNAGYGDYGDFLASLSSRKRKNLRKERTMAQNGINIEHLTGDAIRPEHWDAFFGFYQDTGRRKWGQPYLNRAFFEEIHKRMRGDIVLIMARMDGQWIAGALNFTGGDALYGRYWGCTVQKPGLHFELCYHQAIEAAITRGLKRVEAGAQGEHKIARGYVPVCTHSAHWFADNGLHTAVDDYLARERQMVEQDVIALEGLTPFRKDKIDLSLGKQGRK